MSRRGEKNLLIGLDIGTSKIAALVGELKEDEHIEVIGIGTHPSRGLKKGVVVDIESTVQSIQRAVEEAEGSPPVPLSSMFEDVYAEIPWHLAEQRDSLLAGKG